MRDTQLQQENGEKTVYKGTEGIKGAAGSGDSTGEVREGKETQLS